MNTKNPHEVMTEEMNRIKSERDFLIKIIGEKAYAELLKLTKENRELKEENAILQSNIIQLQCLGKSDEYSG